jgi:hypothetical protein
MAKCKRCKKEMCDLNTKTCAYEVVEFPDGTKMSPIPYNPPDPNIRCHDCGIAAGGVHHVGCDMEICPRCGGQFLGCSCFVSEDRVNCTNIQSILSKGQFKELYTFIDIIKLDFLDFCIVNGVFRSRNNSHVCVVEANFDYLKGMNFIIANIKAFVKMLSALDKKAEITVAVDYKNISFNDGYQTVTFKNSPPDFCDNKFVTDNEINKILHDNIDKNKPLIKETLPKSIVHTIYKVSRVNNTETITFKHSENNLNEGNFLISPTGLNNASDREYTIKLKEKLLTQMDKDHYFSISNFPFTFNKSDMILNYKFFVDQNILAIVHDTKVDDLPITIYSRSAYIAHD